MQSEELIKAIRFEIDGRWTAYEMGRFMLSISNLYNLQLLMRLYPEVIRSRNFASAVDVALSNDQPVPGHFSQTISDEEVLKVLRINYGSPGIADLAGLGTIVGHVKDLAFKLIDIVVTSKNRKLEIRHKELELKKQEAEYFNALIEANQSQRETELKLEKLDLENKALRAESIKKFLEPAEEVGISQIGDILTITDDMSLNDRDDITGRMKIVIRQVGMEHLEQLVNLEQDWLILLISSGKIKSIKILEDI